MRTRLLVLNLQGLLQENRWRAFLPELPQARQRRVLSCRKEEDAARLTGVGLLLRRALMDAGIPAENQIFSENKWGKPYLPGGPEFSLSHAGAFAVCALDAFPVGADVETARITGAVAERFFHPDEVSFLQTLPVFEQADARLRLWTAKEAYTKYLGGGLHVPFSSFCVRLTENGASLELPENVPFLHEYRLGGCRLCLCSRGERPELEFVSIK